MKFFKDIKKNEVKESIEQIQKNITTKDLSEQYKKAVNRYKRHLKEYDEEQSQEKYKELIDVHTELKLIEKQIQELKLIDNELNDNDFNVKSEDINESEETRQANKEKLPEDIKQKIEIAEEIFKQTEEIESEHEITPEIIHENNQNTELLITGDDGIIRPKSMHDQIESNKCLFCEEKFGFTQDCNVHMMREHPEQLIEHNKKEIENMSDPDLQVIQDEIQKRKIESKEEYDFMMNEVEKDSPYAIQKESDITPLNHEPQIIPDQIKEIAEKLEILTKPVIPTDDIINLDKIITKKKPKIKFNLSKIFQKKKYSKLKGIEAYCNICKHTVQQHEYLGKSEGCVKCGCLKTVQEILEINEVDLKYGEEKQLMNNGIFCICGHSQLTHKENAKFCEVEDCHCVRFRTK